MLQIINQRKSALILAICLMGGCGNDVARIIPQIAEPIFAQPITEENSEVYRNYQTSRRYLLTALESIKAESPDSEAVAYSEDDYDYRRHKDRIKFVSNGYFIVEQSYADLDKVKQQVTNESKALLAELESAQSDRRVRRYVATAESKTKLIEALPSSPDNYQEIGSIIQNLNYGERVFSDSPIAIQAWKQLVSTGERRQQEIREEMQLRDTQRCANILKNSGLPESLQKQRLMAGQYRGLALTPSFASLYCKAGMADGNQVKYLPGSSSNHAMEVERSGSLSRMTFTRLKEGAWALSDIYINGERQRMTANEKSAFIMAIMLSSH